MHTDNCFSKAPVYELHNVSKRCINLDAQHPSKSCRKGKWGMESPSWHVLGCMQEMKSMIPNPQKEVACWALVGSVECAEEIIGTGLSLSEIKSKAFWKSCRTITTGRWERYRVQTPHRIQALACACNGGGATAVLRVQIRQARWPFRYRGRLWQGRSEQFLDFLLFFLVHHVTVWVVGRDKDSYRHFALSFLGSLFFQLYSNFPYRSWMKLVEWILPFGWMQKDSMGESKISLKPRIMKLDSRTKDALFRALIFFFLLTPEVLDARSLAHVHLNLSEGIFKSSMQANGSSTNGDNNISIRQWAVIELGIQAISKRRQNFSEYPSPYVEHTRKGLHEITAEWNQRYDAWMQVYQHRGS